jgi:hypothetical protein
MQTQKQNLPFAGLTLVMYSTGNRSPKMEYQASSTKAQFKCTLTKKMFDLNNVQGWLNTPEVQEYVRAGYVLKWGAKTVEGEPTKYSNGLRLEVTYYMVKPFNKSGHSPQPQMQQPQQSYQQAKQGFHLSDDKLPESPSEEIDWAKESPTDFNPDQYEQELG